MLDSRGELVVVVFLSVLAVTLMFLTDSTQAQIARHVEDFALTPFRAVDRGVRHVRALFVSNQELRQEIAATRLALARTDEMRRENERLRAMLGFEARETLELIGCEIMAEGAGHLGRASVVLNRGYNDGIRQGQALAGREGLAGKVIEVRPRRSQALLLTHPDCAVAVRVERSRIAGIVEWSPGSFSMLKLRNLSYLADVKVGDRLISSGLGGVFPEGVTVGEVTEIEKGESGLLLDVDVRPVVDFQTLEELFALRSADRADSTTADLEAEVIPFRRDPLPGPMGPLPGPE
jgi:rod shape-determining protein MreC